ncbi:MAG: flagellar hook-associated protein FlgK [Syntrophales bacterium]
MGNISSIFNIAKEGLWVNQTGIATVGSNVANVNTPGYSRQRAVIGARSQYDVPESMVLTGTQVINIERLYDKYLEFQMVGQSDQLGYADERKKALDRIEAIFNESRGGGIHELLDRFWKAWEDLAANPAGQTERTALVYASQNLAAMFREYSGELYNLQQELNTGISRTVSRLNGYLADIADLNYKVIYGPAGQNNINDILDKRSELLKKVSDLIDINYVETSEGAVNVFLSNGIPLVEVVRSRDLAVQANARGVYDIILADDPTKNVTSAVTGGRLGGMLEMRDHTIAGYLANLDDLAGNMINEVNALHARGYDRYGNVGGNFFEPFNAIMGVRDMRVDATIVAEPNRIAASSTVNDDGENALAIGSLKDALIMGGTATAGDYYAVFLGNIGQAAADAERSLSHETSVMTQLQNQHEQVSGVSIDEEMMNLVKFQLGYNAAAKMVSVAEEMLVELLKMVER